MQTTSFQGISPQFAATKPNPQSNIRQIQSPRPIQGEDTVRFGAGDEKTKETIQNSDNKERSFGRKVWDGVKQGFTYAITPKRLLQGFGVGCIGAIATAIIPPHLHALAAIPFIMITWSLIDFCKGAYKGFKGEKI